MSATDELNQALDPLIQRTMQRAKRVQQLQTQPPTEQTAKAIASELREIELARTVTANATRIVEALSTTTQTRLQKAAVYVGRVQEVSEDAAHFESLFHRTLDLFAQALPDPEPHEMPPLVLSGRKVLARMHHLKTSPSTYVAAYPHLYPAPTNERVPRN